MKHFLIYTNRHKDRELATTKRICDFLRLKGKRVTVMAEAAWQGREPEPGSSVPGDADCMIVLGGDGTVLQAARLTKTQRIPIIGVNLGTLGYMTEVELPNLEESLERLIVGDYVQESRSEERRVGKECL